MMYADDYNEYENYLLENPPKSWLRAKRDIEENRDDDHIANMWEIVIKNCYDTRSPLLSDCRYENFINLIRRFCPERDEVLLSDDEHEVHKPCEEMVIPIGVAAPAKKWKEDITEEIFSLNEESIIIISEKPEEPEEPKKISKYVPPHMRRTSQQNSQQLEQKQKKLTKDDFPALS